MGVSGAQFSGLGMGRRRRDAVGCERFKSDPSRGSVPNGVLSSFARIERGGIVSAVLCRTEESFPVLKGGGQ